MNPQLGNLETLGHFKVHFEWSQVAVSLKTSRITKLQALWVGCRATGEASLENHAMWPQPRWYPVKVMGPQDS